MQPRLLKEPIRLAGQPLLRLQSDERLVRLVQDGHGPAFGTLVDRYRPALLRYCTRLVGEQRAEDAVQQTFVNAHRALTEHDVTTTDLRAWLYRIAHNAALNLLRGEREGWSLDDPAAAGASLTRGSDDVADTVERREHLERTLAAISALPAAQRDALVLRELEGRSHVEIAGALGVTAGAARQHLMRARAAVRAAAAAVTPYPLLTRVAEAMSAGPAGERTAAVAGAGLGAGLAKLSAGLLAGGALAGGAAVGTGVVPSPLHHRHHAPARLQSAAPAAPAGTAAEAVATTPATPVPVALTTKARAPHTSSSSHRRGSSSGHQGGRHHSGDGSDDNRTTSHSSGSGASGSGDDRTSGTSGSSGHTSGGDDGDSHRSGSTSSSGRTSGSSHDGGSESSGTSSGGSGSSTGGSDDTATTASTSGTTSTSGSSGSSDTYEESRSGSTPSTTTVPLATATSGPSGSGSSGSSGSGSSGGSGSSDDGLDH